MTKIGRVSALLMVALTASTCSESSKKLHESVAAALSGPHLGARPTVLRDALKLDAAAKRFSFTAEGQRGLRADSTFELERPVVSVARPDGRRVTLTPVQSPLQVSSAEPRDGSLVYAAGNGAVVLTPHALGVKEDLVLTRSLGDALTFEWELQLDDGLQASLERSGDVVIAPAQSSGTAEGGFRIPAPFVRDAAGREVRSGVRFVLKGNRLQLVAEGLNALSYPLSIDPTLVVTSTLDFGTQANVESGVRITGEQLTRSGTVSLMNPTWGNTTAVPYGRSEHGTVAYNGYLYVLGGSVSGSLTSEVHVAPINADGTIGTFTTLAPLPTGLRAMAVTALNGFLYVIGGTEAAPVASVYFARIGPNGTLLLTGSTTWAGTTPLPSARSEAAIAAHNGVLYVLGGYDGSNAIAEVLYTRPRANGDVDAWTATTALSSVRKRARAVAHNGSVIILGGVNSSNAGLNTVEVAPILPSGALGSWRTTTSLPADRSGHGAVAIDNTLVVTGGVSSGTLIDTTFSAPILGNGSVGNWVSRAALNGTRRDLGLVAHHGTLYAVAGRGMATDLPDVVKLDVTSNAALSTALGTPSTTTPLPVALGPNASAVWGRTVYVTGLNGGVPVTYMGTLSADGSVAAWNTTTALPDVRVQHGLLAANGVLYAVGGRDGSSVGFTTVYYARINANGTLGTWTSTSALPSAHYGSGYAVANNTLYVLGGYPGTQNDVLYARINSDGSLGSWTATTSFTGGRRNHCAVAYNDKLYVLGGDDGTLNKSDVQVATVNTDGTVGAFAATTSLPAVVTSMGCVAHNGGLFVTGGADGFFSNQGTLLSATIQSNGTLGSWVTSSASLAAPRQSHAMVAWRGNLFAIGGIAASNLASVEAIPLQGPIAFGAWSRLFDLSTVGSYETLTINGLSTRRGQVHLSYRTADFGSGWSSDTTVWAAPLGTALALAPTKKRYLWVRLELDDTNTAVSGVANAERDVTDLTFGTLSANGVTCTTGAECSSSFCVDGVCCNVACTNSCDVCNKAGNVGQCAPTVQYDPGSPACGAFLCNGTLSTCPTTCTFDFDCATNHYCGSSTCKPHHLAFVNPARTFPRNGCSLAFTVQTTDTNTNTPVNVSSPLDISFTRSGTTATFFTDASCTQPVGANVTLSSGNQVSVYVKDTVAETLTVGATATNWTGASQNATVQAFGAPARLELQTEPTSGTAGVTLPTVQARVVDSAGNLVTNATTAVTVALGNAMGATLAGTLTVNAVGGIASFSTLSLQKSGTGYTLGFTAAGLTSATSAPFSVAPGAAVRLAFTTQPPNGVAGNMLNPGPQVTAYDAYDNQGSTPEVNVTLSIATGPAGASLTGGGPATANQGVASFGVVKLDKAGSYTLTATAGALTATSASFTIAAGTPTKLAFRATPSASGNTAGSPLTPSTQVEIQDSNGNVTSSTATVTLALASGPGGATLGGTTTVAAVSGVATFGNLLLTRVGTTYSLSASSAGLTPPASATPVFSVTHGAPAALSFSRQPASVTADQPLTVDVDAVDAYGNRCTSSSGQDVVLNLGTNPTGATLGGELGGTMTAGTISLQPTVRVVGTGYTIVATSPQNLTSATSNAFSVTAGPTAGVRFLTAPSDAVAGVAITPAVRVALVDAFGNARNAGVEQVGVSIFSAPAGATLGGTVNVNTSAGVATFSNLTGNKAGAWRLQAARQSGGASDTSPTFTITGAAASALVFTSSPASVTAGACSSAVTLGVQDTFGNPTTAGSAVTATLSATGLTFYSDASCTQVTTTATIGAGQASGSFYFVGTGTGSVVVTASSSLGNPTQSETLVAGGATRVAIITPARSAVAGTCSAAITLQAQDNFGNVRGVTQDTPVTLTGGTNVGWYLDSGCATAVTSVLLTPGNSSPSVYFRSDLVQTFSFSPTSTLTTTSQAGHAVTPGPMAKLRFTDAAPTVTAGSCSPLRTVEIVDAFGNVRPASSAVTVNLSAPGAVFYSDATCTTVVTSRTFPGGTNTVSFAYRFDASGSPAVRVIDANNALSEGAESPTITPGAAARLRFVLPPGTSVAGMPVAGPPQVAIEDALGNRVTTSTALVSLALSTNTQGATLSGAVDVSAAAGLASFTGVIATRAGTGFTLVASANGLTGATSDPFNVNPGSATGLAFTGQPLSTTAGTTFAPAIAVSVQDAYGNTVPTNNGTVLLSVDVTLVDGGTIGGAALSGTTVAGITQGVASFAAVNLQRAGTGYRLRASSAAAADAVSAPFDISAGAASKLTFLAAPSIGRAGQVLSPAVQVGIGDAFGNVVPGQTATVALTLGSGSGASGTLGGTASVPAVDGVATFSDLTISRGGSYFFTAATAGLQPAASGTLVITAADASKLAFSSAPQTVNVGACSEAVIIESRDMGGTAAPVPQPTEVQITGSAGLQFFSDPACTTPVSSVTIFNTSATFYFSTPNRGSLTIRVEAATLAAATQTETVLGTTDPPSLTPQATSVQPNATVSFTVVGGQPPFTFTVSTNNSGATIDDTGLYTAGANEGEDVVRVTDATNATGTARVTVSKSAKAPELPPEQRPPANGWSCGCDASSAGGLGLWALALFATRSRRRSRIGTAKRGSRVASLLGVVLLLAAPAFAAGNKTTAAAPKTGKTSKKPAPTPTPEPAPTPPPPAPVIVTPEPPPPAPPKPKGKPSVAIPDVEVSTKDEKLDASAFTELLTNAVDASGLFKVISAKEIATMLGIERQKALLGCSDNSSCMAEIADALGSEFVMSASVGKVGDGYLVATRLIDARGSRVVARSSVQATSANRLLEGLWRSTQETLDGYGRSLPPEEAKQWSERPKPTPPATLVAEDGPVSQFGIAASAIAGYQPLSVAGQRGSIGAEVDLSWRRGRLDLGAGVIIAPSPGARIFATFAILDGRFRLDAGLRGTAFPGLLLFGGGLTVGAEFGLNRIFAVQARVAGEVYPTSGTVIFAMLGSAGVAAHF